MARLSLWLMGPFVARLGGEPLSGFRSDKVRALLAYLSVEAHRPWTRATLADLLWPDFPDRTAQSNLRNALSNLRRVLGDPQAHTPYLHITQTTVQFNVAAGCWVDVHAFLDLLPQPEQDERLVSDPATTVQATLVDLEQALTLVRGEFMEGFALPSNPFEEWLSARREQTRREVRRAVSLLALAHTQLGDLTTASNYTWRWLELEPWDEAAHRHMMQLLAQREQRTAALTQYETCRAYLRQEFGIEPEPETIYLYEQIRDGHFPAHSIPRPPLAWPGLQDDVPAPTPILFVAREKELATLSGALAQAAAGQGGVYFVIGEPGSGKTALLAEFARRALAHDPHLLVAWGLCNAFTGQGDPYFPFLTMTRILAGEVPASPLSKESIADQAQRLWQCLPTTLDALLEHGPDLINRFLSGESLLAFVRRHNGVTQDRLQRLERLLQQFTAQPPQQRLQQVALFEQFAGVMHALAHHHPLLLIVDDMQWIDSGSIGLLFHLTRQLAGRRILLLGAYRPEEAALRRGTEPNCLLDAIDELQAVYGEVLIDLSQSAGEAFVDAFLDSEPNQLDRQFRAMLYDHTSGNPLFTIELLRGMQLRGEIRRSREGQWVEGARLNWNLLPVRVDAVIARRISHLSPACRESLNVASVEGEQFTAEVIASVLRQDPSQVSDLLSHEAGHQHRLVTAHTIRRLDTQDLALYRFRHGLFQVFLYNHLDVVEKAHLHGLVARKLEQVYEKNLERFPEMTHALARHFASAGLADKAVQYYTHAARSALQLSANREAVDHLYNALRLLHTLPPTAARDRQELELQLILGPPLTATKGWAPPELAAAYERAQELCARIEDNPQLIPALWLLATYHIGRSEHAEVDKLVDRLYRLAQQAGDADLLVLASLQVSPFYQGRFAEARQSLEQCVATQDLTQQRRLALQYGLAPAVTGLAYLAECLWVLGLPKQAEQRMQEACELAGKVQHPMAACYAFGRACWLTAGKGDLEGVRSHATALNQVAEKYELQNFSLAAQFFTEWAAIQGGAPTVEGIAAMHRAIETYHATGTVLNRTGFLVFFAQACGKAGQVARGLAAVDESLALAEVTGERWFQANAYLIKGYLLRLQAAEEVQPEATLGAADACFTMARQVAEQQGRKTFLFW